MQPKDDPEVRLTLLRESYREVLAATTHTDDKIGRLLTGLAFLTAAALAASGLSGTEYLRSDFNLAGYETPFAILALGTFLVLVLCAVLILVSAFSTPLRLPTAGKTTSDKIVPWVKWQDPNTGTQVQIKGSPIYFNEIARLSVERWKEKASAPTDQMLQEREGSLIYEIHNLAIRATHKSRLVSRASEFCTLAIAALAVAFIFTLSGAAHQGAAGGDDSRTAIPLGWGTAAPVAAVLGFVVYLNLYSRLRETCDETSGSRPWYIIHPASTAVGVAVLAFPPMGGYTATWKLILTLILTAIAGFSLLAVFQGLNSRATQLRDAAALKGNGAPSKSTYEGAWISQFAGVLGTFTLGITAALIGHPWPAAPALGFHLALGMAFICCAVTTFRLPQRRASKD